MNDMFSSFNNKNKISAFDYEENAFTVPSQQL